jgi:putative transcriptional regulator
MEYAAGTLPKGPAYVVAAHLALQPKAKADVDALDAAGGFLLDMIEPVALAKPDWLADEKIVRLHASKEEAENDVAHVLSCLDQGRWKRNLAGMLVKPVHGGTAQLLKLEAGRRVPHHGHHGLELTLVLSGAFEDGHGTYRRGDLVVHDEDSDHQPGAMATSDCICLISQVGPVRLSGPMGWFINPFLS